VSLSHETETGDDETDFFPVFHSKNSLYHKIKKLPAEIVCTVEVCRKITAVRMVMPWRIFTGQT
jgi:hypothetical protein